MSKITVLMIEKHSGEGLSSLRKLGIVHIKHTTIPASEGITALEHRASEADKAIAALADNIEGAAQKEFDKDQAHVIVKEIIALQKSKYDNGIAEAHLKEKINWFGNWGNVHHAIEQELKKSGIFLKLYICDKKRFEKIPGDKQFYVIKHENGLFYIAFFGFNQSDTLDCVAVEMPARDLYFTQKKLEEIHKERDILKQKTIELAAYKNALRHHKNDLVKKLEFSRVKFGMGKAGEICYLEGFCPKESLPELQKLSDSQGWAILKEEPDNPEETPVLLRNSKFINIISPVFKFMGILPGYAEFDVSACFLIFFSLFCSILVGDAGYGSLFILLAFFLHKKVKAVPRDLIFLIYILGSGTVIWGAITGAWFGLESAVKVPFLKAMVVDRLNTWTESNQPVLMQICFFIGAVHLSVAHAMSALNKRSLQSFADCGWIAVVWGMFFYAGYFVLNLPLPPFANYLILVGAGIVLSLANYQKNFVKYMQETLSSLPLTLLAFISAFADVVSYIRLFAVGFASGAIASTFNNMLLGGEAGGGIFKAILAIIALIAAHAFNIVLGLVAIFVHGIRLNLLEFSGHSGLQWSGNEYRPFKQ